jgi:hypothetical protein
MPFRNYSLTKGGNLTIGSMQSPDYAAGAAGWQVRKDGSAEFNDLVIRGEFNGAFFFIDSTGAFFYDPVTGSLAASIASAAGTNKLGDAYLAGQTAYFTTPGLVTYALNMSAAGGFTALTWLVNSGSGFTDLASISSSGGGLAIDASASGAVTVNAGSNAIVLDSPVTATGGSASSPTLVTTDIWHTASLGTGWSAGNGVGGIFWRLLSTGDVLLVWDIETSTSSNANVIVTLGSAYRPATAVQLGSGHASGAPAAYTAGFAPGLKIATSGAVTAQGIPSLSGTIELYGSAVIPLGAL